MANQGWVRKLPALLLLLLIPGVAGTLVIRDRISKRSADGADSRDGSRKDRRPLSTSRSIAEEEGIDEEEARRIRLANEAKAQDEDELEGDGGELAMFSTKGAKQTKMGKLPWSTGLQWRVETYYRNLQHPERDEWSPKPILWQFTVRGIEKVDGQDVWVVDIEPTDLSDMPYNPGGSVYVSIEDHTILALKDRIQENGLIRDRYMKFEDAEGGALGTLLPVYLPSPDADALERSSTTAAMAPDPFQPDPKVEAPKTSGKVVDVEFEVEGTTVRERWDTATPYWPSYMSTPSSVSYLKAGS